MKRPYKVKNYKLVGAMAVLMSGFMVVMYIIPFSGSALVWQEWIMAGGWAVLGVVFFAICKIKYGEKFDLHVDIATEDGQQYREEAALEAALETVSGHGTATAVESSMAFSYFLPVNIVFGNGKVNKVGELTKPYGRKVLIVTGKNSAKKSGLYDRVDENLKLEGMDTVLFDKVEQNPLTTTAIEGAEFAKANGCDVVVAIGGGSIMDCAKAIAFLAVNGGDINDYIYGRLKSDHALPLVLIPTTCGTGSEGNGFAVLTNPENGDKKSLRCNAIVAKVSIVDPECMMTMPKHTAGVTLAHGMEHPASGLKDIVHGKGLAALTPVIIEESYKGNYFKFAKIARIFGGLTAGDLSGKIRTLLRNIDMECTLSELGIEEKDVPWMAENCMKVSAAGVANNPIVFTRNEIAEIYRKAM